MCLAWPARPFAIHKLTSALFILNFVSAALGHPEFREGVHYFQLNIAINKTAR